MHSSMLVFSVVKSSGIAGRYQRFRRTYCLHLQLCLYLPAHGVTGRKANICIFTAVLISNLILLYSVSWAVHTMLSSASDLPSQALRFPCHRRRDEPLDRPLSHCDTCVHYMYLTGCSFDCYFAERSCLVFGISLFQISVRRPATRVEVFHGVPQSLYANEGIFP
jgi:hypothetical protein